MYTREDLLKTYDEIKEKIQTTEITDEVFVELENELNEWTTRIDLGFDQILSSILSDNATGIADGLNTILTLFNEQVKFKNYNEFDAFFMNENCILTL